MFWGLNLKPNRKYSQTTSKSFHISQASLEDGDLSKVYITTGNQKFLICTLENKGCKQVFLDLNFGEGEEVSFQTVGSGNVTLSGYVLNDEDDEDFESDVSDSEILKQLAGKGKNSDAGDGEEDDDEDDDDFDEDGEGEGEGDSELDSDDLDGLEGSDGEEEVEEDDDEDDSDDDEEDEEISQPKAKQPKLEKNAKQNGVAKKSEKAAAAPAADKKSKKEKKDKKKENEKPQQQQPKQKQQQQPQAGGERTITGGVKVEDVRVGNGPEAKTGKRAVVYYEGRLKSNNKVFDSLKQGTGFKFAVGRGEVIKAWDAGVVGMKVGGKRRITCPPHMAYGARGHPPTIPPNSTLVFEVELKGVN